MRITCNRCGKAVSQEVPEGTLVRAFIECPECVAKGWSQDGEFSELNNKELLDAMLNEHFLYSQDWADWSRMDKLMKAILRRMEG